MKILAIVASIGLLCVAFTANSKPGQSLVKLTDIGTAKPAVARSTIRKKAQTVRLGMTLITGRSAAHATKFPPIPSPLP